MSDLGNKEVFAKNLNYYMRINNVDRNKLCNDLEFNYTTVREWTNGTAYPRIDKIEMLANYFGILKSDLIEDKKKDINAIQNNNLLNKRQILFDKSKDILSDDDWATIEFIMNKTIDNYEKNKRNENE